MSDLVKIRTEEDERNHVESSNRTSVWSQNTQSHPSTLTETQKRISNVSSIGLLDRNFSLKKAAAKHSFKSFKNSNGSFLSQRPQSIRKLMRHGSSEMTDNLTYITTLVNSPSRSKSRRQGALTRLGSEDYISETLYSDAVEEPQDSQNEIPEPDPTYASVNVTASISPRHIYDTAFELEKAQSLTKEDSKTESNLQKVRSSVNSNQEKTYEDIDIYQQHKSRERQIENFDFKPNQPFLYETHNPRLPVRPSRSLRPSLDTSTTLSQRGITNSTKNVHDDASTSVSYRSKENPGPSIQSYTRYKTVSNLEIGSQSLNGNVGFRTESKESPSSCQTYGTGKNTIIPNLHSKYERSKSKTLTVISSRENSTYLQNYCQYLPNTEIELSTEQLYQSHTLPPSNKNTSKTSTVKHKTESAVPTLADYEDKIRQIKELENALALATRSKSTTTANMFRNVTKSLTTKSISFNPSLLETTELNSHHYHDDQHHPLIIPEGPSIHHEILDARVEAVNLSPKRPKSPSVIHNFTTVSSPVVIDATDETNIDSGIREMSVKNLTSNEEINSTSHHSSSHHPMLNKLPSVKEADLNETQMTLESKSQVSMAKAATHIFTYKPPILEPEVIEVSNFTPLSPAKLRNFELKKKMSASMDHLEEKTKKTNSKDYQPYALERKISLGQTPIHGMYTPPIDRCNSQKPKKTKSKSRLFRSATLENSLTCINTDAINPCKSSDIKNQVVNSQVENDNKRKIKHRCPSLESKITAEHSPKGERQTLLCHKLSKQSNKYPSTPISNMNSFNSPSVDTVHRLTSYDSTKDANLRESILGTPEFPHRSNMQLLNVSITTLKKRPSSNFKKSLKKAFYSRSSDKLNKSIKEEYLPNLTNQLMNTHNTLLKTAAAKKAANLGKCSTKEVKQEIQHDQYLDHMMGNQIGAGTSNLREKSKSLESLVAPASKGYSVKGVRMSRYKSVSNSINDFTKSCQSAKILTKSASLVR